MSLEEISVERLKIILYCEEQRTKDNCEYKKKRLEELKQLENTSLELIFENLYIETLEPFNVLPTPYGKIISYEEGSYYYRGENQIYAKSIPSLNRQFNEDIIHNESIRMIAELRLLMFKNLIFQLDIVKQWNNCKR